MFPPFDIEQKTCILGALHSLLVLLMVLPYCPFLLQYLLGVFPGSGQSLCVLRSISSFAVYSESMVSYSRYRVWPQKCKGQREQCSNQEHRQRGHRDQSRHCRLCRVSNFTKNAEDQITKANINPWDFSTQVFLITLLV